MRLARSLLHVHVSDRPRALLGRLFSSPTALTVTLFLAFYLVAFWTVRHKSSRDPGSWFFNPVDAYIPRYSAVRLQQAEQFLDTADHESFRRRNTSSTPELCVGVASIAREGARYLRTTVASLLEGLTEAERSEIHLTVFIPHLDPTIHPAYNDPWLGNLVDELLLYNLSGAEYDRMQHLEETNEWRWKIMLDYQHLMKACYNTGAPYMALLEDDTLAMDGWYHRTMKGLAKAEEIATRKGARNGFLYLRLFYTEEYLGWNIEELTPHILWSFLLILTVAATLIWLRAAHPTTKTFLTNRVILAITSICIPLSVALFFAAGKVTTMPFPAGINIMNKYGCCTQGLAWPRHKAAELMTWYEEQNPMGYSDVLIEQYADRRGELRLAITPSVIQHVSAKSSKADGVRSQAKQHRPITQKLWNFQFELNDAGVLEREHALAVADVG